MTLKGSNYAINNSHTKQLWESLKSTSSLHHEGPGTGLLSLETKISAGQLEWLSSSVQLPCTFLSVLRTLCVAPFWNTCLPWAYILYASECLPCNHRQTDCSHACSSKTEVILRDHISSKGLKKVWPCETFHFNLLSDVGHNIILQSSSLLTKPSSDICCLLISLSVQLCQESIKILLAYCTAY